MKTLTLLAIAAVSSMGLFSTKANATTLYADPENNYFNSILWGSDNSNLDAAYFSTATGFALTEFYKDNGPGEAGLLAGSYQTDLVGGSTTGDVTVTYTGGDILSGQMYAYAKDGNSDPNWFLWDLTALGWDGQSTLLFDGPLFFKKNDSGSVQTQAYSHVSLFSTTTTTPTSGPGPGGNEVPDGGTTIVLFGLALLGFWGFAAAQSARTRTGRKA